jgi:hypothetical protein
MPPCPRLTVSGEATVRLTLTTGQRRRVSQIIECLSYWRSTSWTGVRMTCTDGINPIMIPTRAAVSSIASTRCHARRMSTPVALRWGIRCDMLTGFWSGK